MTGAREDGDGSGDQEDLDQPVFSLVRGKYRHAKRYGGEMTLLFFSERRGRLQLTITPRCSLLDFVYIQGTEEIVSNGGVGSSALILRNKEDALSKMDDNAAGMSLLCPAGRIGYWMFNLCTAQFLHQRTYQGLETRIGQDAPSLLEQGRSGIARGYDDDHRDGDSG